MTVSNQIIQVLDALCEKFGMAIDWTSENVIPYISVLCEKLITWEIWSSVAWIGIMMVASVISIIITVRYKVFSEDIIDAFDIIGCFIIIGLIGLWVCTVICIGVQIFDIIKCNTFPELYIFEYIQTMVNGTN